MEIREFYNKKEYPLFPFLKERRRIELFKVLKEIENKGKSFLDIGCGDCYLINCLYHLTDLKLSGCDFSRKLLKNANKNLDVFYCDCKKLKTKLKADIIFIGNVLMYLEDNEIDNLVKKLDYKYLIVRSTCGKDEKISSFSKRFKCHYEAYYRSKQTMKNILPNLINMYRAYPNEIESEFNTKQYYFIYKKS